jgi:AcrR family transcriptional regulator
VRNVKRRARVSNASSRRTGSSTRVNNAEGPRSAKGERTRKELLKGATAVFERDGFLNARIADIAEKAGVSHGSFYHYFDSKEQIFRELAEELEITLLSVTPADVGHRDPIERIRTANRDYLAAYVRSAKIMRVIEEVSRYDDEVRKIRDVRDDEFNDRLERAIRRLQDEGSADRALDASYAAFALGCMVARFAEMFARRGIFDFDKAVEQLTLLWAGAIGLRPARDHRPASRRSGSA